LCGRPRGEDAQLASAETAALLCAQRRARGRPIEMRDTLIAGVVKSRRGKLATRNVKHFHDLDVSVVDPWAA
jgi:toxin FitB